ncbi:MAG: HTH domain-containing protein [Steroidobacteraceae bacterium]|jgi:predicted DNA-binding transcriptional regulator YafY
MRASRLLRILLILQNRGRVTTLQLAGELEVARRTVLRDLDALAEAGLPIVTHRGNDGGVELGFNYRSRFVGLDADEAEAMGVILGSPKSALAELGIQAAANRACDKLVESFSNTVRERVQEAQRRFQFEVPAVNSPDPRVAALAGAIRNSAIVRLAANSPRPRMIHPIALHGGPDGWAVVDALDTSRPIPQSSWGDVNISAHRFTSAPRRE